MGEVGGPNTVRFLRGFIGRARRQEGVALHSRGFVHKEGLTTVASLEASDGARSTGVKDSDVYVGWNVVDLFSQALVREPVFAKQQATIVGVPGIVDDHFASNAFGWRFEHSLLHFRQGL